MKRKIKHPAKPDPLPAMWREFQALDKQLNERTDTDADVDTHPAYPRWEQLADKLLTADATTAEGLEIKIIRLTDVMAHSDIAKPSLRERMLASFRRSAANVARKAVRG